MAEINYFVKNNYLLREIYKSSWTIFLWCSLVWLCLSEFFTLPAATTISAQLFQFPFSNSSRLGRYFSDFGLFRKSVSNSRLRFLFIIPWGTCCYYFRHLVFKWKICGMENWPRQISGLLISTVSEESLGRNWCKEREYNKYI